MLKEQIGLYLAEESPSYGFLIEGGWGSGKTHEVKKIIKEDLTHLFIYVSLNGLSQSSEIDSQISAQMVQEAVKSKKLLNFKDRSEVGLNLPNVNLSQFGLVIGRKVVLVFDDLERSLMDIRRLLGYLNSFIEHQNLRVIAMCDVDKLEQKEIFHSQSEKIFGKTQKVKGDLRQAYKAFSGQFNDSEIEEVLIRTEASFQYVMINGQRQNLRLLNYAVQEFVRFYRLLPDRAKKNIEYLHDAAKTIAAVSMLIRSQYYSLDNLNSKSDVEIAEDVNFNFGSQNIVLVPDAKVLKEFLSSGTVDKLVLQDSVSNSRYFVDEKTPEWIKLWHFSELSTSDFKLNFNEAKRKFFAGEYNDQLVLRHIIGIFLYLTYHRVVVDDESISVGNLKQQIYKMSSANLIEPMSKTDMTERDLSSSHGLGVYSSDTEEFKDVTFLLKDYNRSLAQKAMERFAENIPVMIQRAPDITVESIMGRVSGNTNYSRIPIFAKVSPEKFFEAWKNMKPAKHRLIFGLFQDRYMDKSSIYLADELMFLAKFRNLGIDAIEKLDPPLNYNLNILVFKGLNPAIERLKAEKERIRNNSVR